MVQPREAISQAFVAADSSTGSRQSKQKTAERSIMRSVQEGARDTVRDIATSDVYLFSRCPSTKVEVLFAHLKRILKLDRCAFAIRMVRSPSTPTRAARQQRLL
jgi:hypothetical protein